MPGGGKQGHKSLRFVHFNDVYAIKEAGVSSLCVHVRVFVCV